MSTIFIIRQERGGYGDSWSINLFAVASEEQAELEVAQLTEQHAFVKSIWREVYMVWSDGCMRLHAAARSTERHKDLKESGIWNTASVKLWEVEVPKIIELAMNKAIELGCSERHLELMGFTAVKGELRVPTFDEDATYSYDEIELL